MVEEGASLLWWRWSFTPRREVNRSMAHLPSPVAKSHEGELPMGNTHVDQNSGAAAKSARGILDTAICANVTYAGSWEDTLGVRKIS